jgi:nitroreductase
MRAIHTPEAGLSALDAIYRRRAVRAYTGAVPDEATIRKLLEAAVQAPTAVHLEPWAFVVVQNKDTLRRLSDRAKAMALDAAEHHDLLKPPGAAPDGDRLAVLASSAFNVFYDASTLIAICGKPVSAYAAADCWLAADNLMLAACAMGLGTCPIGFALPVLNAPEVKAELGIPPDVTVIAPIIVGVPAHALPPVPRKPPDILRWLH